jgi:hypothetical protein
MAANSFSCPSCQAVLRLPSAVAAGTKIKCPKCEAVFAVPDDEALLPTAVRDEGRPVTPSRRGREVDDDPGEDDPDRPSPTSVRSRRAADEFGRRAEIDEDERDSHRTRRPGRRPNKRNQAGSGLLVGLLVGGIVLFLGAGVFAAWVWPGFLLFAGVPAATGQEDVLAYLPADCPFFMGMDIDQMQTEWGNALPGNWGAGPGFNPDFKPQKMAFAFRVDVQAFNFEMVFVVKTKAPYKEEEMRRSFQGQDRQTAHGKVYYKMNTALLNQAGGRLPPGFNKTFLVGMPNDRIVICGNMSPKQMEALLAADGTRPSISAEALALVQDVNKAPFWFVFHVNQTMKPLMAMNPQGAFAGLGPDVSNALTRMKGISGALSFAGAVKGTISLVCADANDASKVTDTFRTLWNEKGKAAVPNIALSVRLLGANNVAQAVEEASKSLSFQNSGVKAQVSFTVAKATVERVIPEIQRLGQMGGAFGGAGPMGGAGPNRPFPPKR